MVCLIFEVKALGVCPLFRCTVLPIRNLVDFLNIQEKKFYLIEKPFSNHFFLSHFTLRRFHFFVEYEDLLNSAQSVWNFHSTSQLKKYWLKDLNDENLYTKTFSYYIGRTVFERLFSFLCRTSTFEFGCYLQLILAVHTHFDINHNWYNVFSTDKPRISISMDEFKQTYGGFIKIECRIDSVPLPTQSEMRIGGKEGNERKYRIL